MLINKEKLPLVAMDFMNSTHFEDVDIINELYYYILKYAQDPVEKNFESVNEHYKIWQNHTVEHFKAEEVMMQEKRFPAYMMHKGEHDNTLLKMQAVYDKWIETKDIEALQNYFQEELLQWLINHIQTMDTVTAMFFKTGLSPCSAARI